MQKRDKFKQLAQPIPWSITVTCGIWGCFSFTLTTLVPTPGSLKVPIYCFTAKTGEKNRLWFHLILVLYVPPTWLLTRNHADTLQELQLTLTSNIKCDSGTLIVGCWCQMGWFFRNISETADLLGFSYTIVSRVHTEWCEKQQTSRERRVYTGWNSSLTRELRLV